MSFSSAQSKLCEDQQLEQHTSLSNFHSKASSEQRTTQGWDTEEDWVESWER